MLISGSPATLFPKEFRPEALCPTLSEGLPWICRTYDSESDRIPAETWIYYSFIGTSVREHEIS